MPESHNRPPAQQRAPRPRDYVLAILQMLGGWIKKHIKLFLVLLLLIGLGIGGFKVYGLRQGNKTMDTDSIIVSASKQANISGDPNPAVLEVIDKEKTNQPFLNESKEGDRVLLYYKSKKAVLFRPSRDKVIKVGAYEPPAAKVIVRKGTTSDTRVNAILTKLKTVEHVEFLNQDSSGKTDYGQTIVVDITNRYDAEPKAVASAVNGTLRTMPQSEIWPEADILVIVGAK